MLLYVAITVLVVVAAAVAYPLVRRPSRLDEVDRFHVARSLTSTWASQPQPDVRVPAPGEEP